MRRRSAEGAEREPMAAARPKHDGRSIFLAAQGRATQKVSAELLNAKPPEIKSFLSGQLASGWTQELQSELLAAGIPF
jgi:hypothetical protein